MCPDSSIRKEISVCAVQAPQWRSCVESGEGFPFGNFKYAPRVKGSSESFLKIFQALYPSRNLPYFVRNSTT